MNRVRYIGIIILFIPGLFMARVSAEQEEFKAIKELQAQEKVVTPETITRPKLEYKAQGLSDPFQKQVSEGEEKRETGADISQVTLPALTVQGVIWGGNFPQAIINDKVVKAEDIIEGAKIVSIDKEGIILLFEGREYKLPSPAATAVPSEAKPQGG